MSFQERREACGMSKVKSPGPKVKSPGPQAKSPGAKTTAKSPSSSKVKPKGKLEYKLWHYY